MNKNLTEKDDNLIKKFNLKEARVSLIPCDESTQNASPSQLGNVQMDVDFQNSNEGIIYVAPECLNRDIMDIFCSQEGNKLEQASGVNLLIPPEYINAEGTFIVQHGDCLSGILLPVMDDQTLQVVRNGEIFSASGMITGMENMSDQNTAGFLFCSDPCANISSMSEGTLQNDVMLGQIAVGTARGTDDDDLVGELRKCLPRRNDLLSDVVNDISEYGIDWHGDLEWNLDQTSMNEGSQTRQMSEAEKLNEEFSKRMREEFAASFVKKNSLMELKKKIGNVKCPKKKEPDGKLENTLDKKEKPCEEKDARKEEQEDNDSLVANSKRSETFAGEPPNKKLKKETSVDVNLKTVQTSKRDEESDKFKQKQAESSARKINKSEEKQQQNSRRPKERQKAKEACRDTKCTEDPLPGSVYCSDECIASHVRHSIQLLHVDNAENATERVVVLDRKTGKLITGPRAPTLNNLLSWIKKHPSFEVLQPKSIPSSQRASKKPTFSGENSSCKSSKGQEKNPCFQADNKKNDEGILKSGIDSQRLTIRRHIQQSLLSKMTESVMMTTQEVKHLAIDLENSVFQNHKSVDEIYRRHCRGLLKLIKEASVEILNGEKSVDEFVRKALYEDDDVLSTDKSTSKHNQHFYDINCQICNPVLLADAKKLKTSEDKPVSSFSKILSPDVTSTSDFCGADLTHETKAKTEAQETFLNVQDVQDHKPSSSTYAKSAVSDTLVDKVWTGFLAMKDVATFPLSAFRTSGSMKLIRKNFPTTLTILGRISKKVVEDYIRTIKATYSNTKEVGVVCFVCDESDKADRESYETFFQYLHSRERCGVVGSLGSTIKDVYIWPLSSTHAIPSFLTPFVGPGLEVNRGDLLLGIVVQQCFQLPLALADKCQDNELVQEKEFEAEDEEEDEEEEDEEETKEYAIISGSGNANKKKDNDVQDFTFPLLAIEKEIKIDEDKPYDPTEVCSTEESSSQGIGSGTKELHKKFENLIDLLNKKPGEQLSNFQGNESSSCCNTPTAFQTRSSESSTESSIKSCISLLNPDQASQCKAATEALASLNVFLEKYIAHKKHEAKPSTVVKESQPNFNLGEITNEQHQLMKQVLETVKARSNNDYTMVSNSDFQTGSISTFIGNSQKTNFQNSQKHSSWADANLPTPDYGQFYNNMNFGSSPSQIVGHNSLSYGSEDVVNQNSYQQPQRNNFFRLESLNRDLPLAPRVNQEAGCATSNYYFSNISYRGRLQGNNSFSSFKNFSGKKNFDSWIRR